MFPHWLYFSIASAVCCDHSSTISCCWFFSSSPTSCSSKAEGSWNPEEQAAAPVYPSSSIKTRRNQWFLVFVFKERNLTWKSIEKDCYQSDKEEWGETHGKGKTGNEISSRNRMINQKASQNKKITCHTSKIPFFISSVLTSVQVQGFSEGDLFNWAVKFSSREKKQNNISCLQGEMWGISPAAVIPLHPVAGSIWDMFVGGMGKRADTFCPWNLSKCTVPFAVCEVSRPPWCSSASAMPYQEDVYLLWFQDTSRWCIQVQVSSLSRTGSCMWSWAAHCGAEKSELHFCSSPNCSLRGSWVGLDSSKRSDFHVHNTRFQQTCPWGWTRATFHEKPLENSLWLSREWPNPPDVEARGRTLLARLLLVSGKELGKQGSA